MLLAVDIGNSTVDFGLFQGRELSATFEAMTRPEATADEYAVLLEAFLRQQGLAFGDIQGCVLSSVVPALSPALVEVAERYLGRSPVVVGAPGVRIGMNIRVEAPLQVGSDRIVSALAARELFGAPAIAIDLGTATTFDVVSPEGDFLGGAIAPGVQVLADALNEKTAKLPRIDLRLPEGVIGRNTVAAMQAGVLYGYAGLVKELVGRIVAELGQPARVVATGGYAPLIVPLVPEIDSLHPHLTLEGLRMVYELNRVHPKPRKGKARCGY